MDPVDGDQVYAAEQLLKSRKRGGKTEYFVKWKGWGAKYNTWEPAENILDERLIQDFEKRHPPRVATKRASEGTAPTTPVPKRGRASKRGADKEETPESSSAASTSASARAARSSRRSRRGDSATSDATTEEKIDEEPAAEKEAVEDKKKEPEKEAEVEKKEEAKAEEKAEAEEPEEKTEEEQPAKQVSEETQDEPEEEEKSAEDEPEKKEDKEEALSLNLDDSANTTAEETPEAAPKAPMEIYVEKTVNGERNEGGSAEAAAAPAINGDAQKEAGADNGNGKEAFVITNADDPNCTHKIQVIHAPTEGTAAETSRDDSSDIEYVETVQKKETVTETVRTEGDDSDDCVVLESTTTETTVTESVVGPTASTEQ